MPVAGITCSGMAPLLVLDIASFPAPVPPAGRAFVKWSWRQASNPRHPDYKSGALPSELHQRNSWRVYLTATGAVCIRLPASILSHRISAFEQTMGRHHSSHYDCRHGERGAKPKSPEAPPIVTQWASVISALWWYASQARALGFLCPDAHHQKASFNRNARMDFSSGRMNSRL